MKDWERRGVAILSQELPNVHESTGSVLQIEGLMSALEAELLERLVSDKIVRRRQ